MAQAAADSSAIRQAEQRGQQIVQELQARALAERGYALSPDELVTTLGATTTLPGDVIARLARADSQDRVAWGAERTRADDLGSASAASFPGGIAHGEYLTAAAQDRLTADTAAAHAAGDRSATRLAAESFPCTAADAVTAAATGAIQAAPSAVRAEHGRADPPPRPAGAILCRARIGPAVTLGVRSGRAQVCPVRGRGGRSAGWRARAGRRAQVRVVGEAFGGEQHGTGAPVLRGAGVVCWRCRSRSGTGPRYRSRRRGSRTTGSRTRRWRTARSTGPGRPVLARLSVNDTPPAGDRGGRGVPGLVP